MLKGLTILTGLAIGSSLPAQTTIPPVGTAAPASAIDKTSQTEDVAFRTAISRQLASSLRLKPGATAELHSVTGVSQVATATVPDLQLTRKGVEIIDAPLLESVNMGADGILGVDTLRSQRVMFDFVGQTMSIVPSSSTHDFTNERGAIVIEAHRRNGRLVITDAVANGHHLLVVLDTGSQVTIGNNALRRVLTGHALSGGSNPVNLISVTGETLVGDYMFVSDLELGGVELHNLAVVFTNAHTFEQLKLEGTPALLLGMNAIRAFKKVSIDFANRQFRVVVPERSENEVRLASARD